MTPKRNTNSNEATRKKDAAPENKKRVPDSGAQNSLAKHAKQSQSMPSIPHATLNPDVTRGLDWWIPVNSQRCAMDSVLEVLYWGAHRRDIELSDACSDLMRSVFASMHDAGMAPDEPENRAMRLWKSVHEASPVFVPPDHVVSPSFQWVTLPILVDQLIDQGHIPATFFETKVRHVDKCTSCGHQRSDRLESRHSDNFIPTDSLSPLQC